MSFFWIIVVLIIVLILIILTWSVHRLYPGITGFEDKRIWDWMEMLFIPLVLGVGAVLLNQAQETRQLALQKIQADLLVVQATEAAGTAIAGVTATSKSNRAILDAGNAAQATQAARGTATSVVGTAQANSTAVAINVESSLRAAEAAGDKIKIEIANENATAQAASAATAVRSTEVALLDTAEAVRATQAAEAIVNAEATATADAINAAATISALQVPTSTPTSIPISESVPACSQTEPSDPFKTVWDLDIGGKLVRDIFVCPIGDTMKVGYVRVDFPSGIALFWESGPPHQIFIGTGNKQGVEGILVLDEWNEGDPEVTCNAVGTVRGFNKALCLHGQHLIPLLGGSANQEVGSSATVQQFQNGWMLNGDDHIGEIITVSEDGWKIFNK